MNSLNRLFGALGFTHSETRVILLLIAAFLAGWGISWYRETHPNHPVFDYASADSEFVARSRLPEDSIDAAAADPGSGADSTGMKKTPGPGERVDINSATKEELKMLPGIGDAMAERIILYRKDHGPFTTAQDLQHVRGIGRKKAMRLSPLCRIH